jgi:hypothetical protein
MAMYGELSSGPTSLVNFMQPLQQRLLAAIINQAVVTYGHTQAVQATNVTVRTDKILPRSGLRPEPLRGSLGCCKVSRALLL